MEDPNIFDSTEVELVVPVTWPPTISVESNPDQNTIESEGSFSLMKAGLSKDNPI